MKVLLSTDWKMFLINDLDTSSLITDCHSSSLLAFFFVHTIWSWQIKKRNPIYFLTCLPLLKGPDLWYSETQQGTENWLRIYECRSVQLLCHNAAQWKTREVVICLGFCSINNATLIYIQLSDYQRPTGSKSVIWLTVIGLSLQPCFQLCFFFSMYEAADV